MFELIFQSTKLKGRRLTLPLGKEIVVGREPGCQLTLNSSLISRRHCELKHVAEGIWVRDLDSQNGTYVNDVAIPAATLLRPGDLLRVGAAVFEVQLSQPKPKPASTAAKAPDEKLSDSEIASWLTDSEGGAATASDTTIIPGGKGRPAPAGEPAGSPAASPRRFKNVKDEAADIIRRHWEKVGRREDPDAR